MLTLVDECRLGFILSTFQPGGIHELELMPFEAQSEFDMAGTTARRPYSPRSDRVSPSVRHCARAGYWD